MYTRDESDGESAGESAAVVQGGIAILTQNDPAIVHGVALGEGDVTEGASGTRTYWPKETLEAAADGLAGKKIVDDSEHDDLEASQPPVSAILGEVTKSAYKDGVGIVFEGEIDDPDVAALIENGRVDVSPALFRGLGEYDDEKDAHTAETIHKWRDLSVVAEGASPSNSIQSGTAAALQGEALQAALDADSEEPTVDDPAESGAGDMGDDPSGGSSMGKITDNPNMDLTQEEEALVRKARTLDNPTLFESDVEALHAEADQFDEPALIEKEQYETTSRRVADIKNALAEALVEQSDLHAGTVNSLSFEALWDEFTDDGDDGIDIAVLTQNPEAGGISEEDEDIVTDDDVQEIESLLSRANMMERHAPGHADALRSDAADLADVESYEEIDLEVL